MKAKLDSGLESWGNFTEKMGEEPGIPGRLSYDPLKGIELQLVENRSGSAVAALVALPSVPAFFGRFVDGTLVTLLDCIITKTFLGAGAVGLPTALIANRALFGAHVADLDGLKLKSYTVELSSLSNWMCVSPVTLDMVKNDGKPIGVDIRFRRPDPIRVLLPDRSFDVQVSHGWETSQGSGSAAAHWHAGITIAAHDGLPFRDASEVAWQCQNLMSLLIGRQLSVKSVVIKPADGGASTQTESPIQLVYHQRGKHDEPDAYPPQMLLPYGLIKKSLLSRIRGRVAARVGVPGRDRGRFRRLRAFGSRTPF